MGNTSVCEETLLVGRERSGGEGTEPQRSERATNNVAQPNPEVLAKPERRQFTLDYKEGIVRQALDCNAPGEIGALLRREGLYWSMLSRWRNQYRAGGRQALRERPSGRKPIHPPVDNELESLRRENQQLQQQLTRAETIIEVQKKLCTLLGLSPSDHQREPSC